MSWFSKKDEVKEFSRVAGELLAMHNQLDDFFNLSRDLFMIVDERGVIKRVNKRWTELLGYKPSEMEGRKFTEFVVPEDLQRTSKRLEENQNKNLDDNSFLNRYRGKNGLIYTLQWRSAKPKDGYIHAVARIVDEDGSPL